MQSILLRTSYGGLHNVYFFYTSDIASDKLVTKGNLDFSLGLSAQRPASEVQRASARCARYPDMAVTFLG